MLGENMCGGLTQPSQVKTISQTEQQLERARNAKENLFSTISLLADRLAPALRLQNLISTGECEKEEKLTDIAEAIKGLGSDFNFANIQLRNLIERLEI